MRPEEGTVTRVAPTAQLDQTFLQSLSPAERSDLLHAARFLDDDGTKQKAGVKRAATTGAKERAARRLSTTTKSSRQTAEDERKDTTWELARLRVQVTALAAENDQLRSNAQGLAQQLCEVKTAARQQLRDATLQCRQTEQAAALRTACVEEQSERQRRVLAELAAAAETMANDNVLLTGEVMSLRESAKLADGHSTALEERVRKLQELYTTGVDAIQESEEHAAGRLPVRFWDQLATAEVLARSRPPTDFPLPALNAAPQPWEQVREFQRVREDNQALEGELKDASRKLREARQAHAVVVDKAIADKRTAREALNHQQSQLVGSLRRIQWLVEQQKAALAREEERRAYIQQLEKRLLNQHRRLHKLQAKAPRRQGGSSEAPPSPPPASRPADPPASTRVSATRQLRATPCLAGRSLDASLVGVQAPPSASSVHTEYATAAEAHMQWASDTPGAPSPAQPGSGPPVAAPAGDGFTLADIEQFTWQLQALHCRSDHEGGGVVGDK